MNGFVLYDFRIDVWQPDTLPLKRLSEYMTELAKLFGSSADVHLLKVRKGSAIPELSVAATAQTVVKNRLALLGRPDAPEDITRAYRKVNDYLREDGGSAVLKLKGGAKVVEFPGCRTPLTDEVVIHEPGSLEGVVIRVGGSDETVPVWLEGESRERLKCSSTRVIAKELALHLFGGPVRVSGNGKWRRNAERLWELEEFSVKSWELLEADSLEAAVDALREVAGNGWAELDDAQMDWQRLRGQS